MTKILITGAKGQLGTDFYNLSSKYPNWEFTFIDIAELDITNTNDTFEFLGKYHFDFLINCAAYTAVDKAESNRESAFAVNNLAVKNLIEGIRKVKTRFIHISTDYVFNGNGTQPYSEGFPTDPQTVYGLSKREGEKAVSEYERGMVIRTAWLYSVHGHNFVKSIIKKGAEVDELKVVDDQIGSPTYSKHLAEAILKIIDLDLSKQTSFIPGIYHFTNTGFCSWYDFALEIIKESNLDCLVKPIKSSEYPLPAKRPAYSVLSLEKIKSLYNLEIPDWKVGLSECLEELRLST